MSAVLEKVRKLERYIEISNGQVDPILESTINKLMGRERQRHLEILGELQAQITAFEAQYELSSDSFYPRFEQGELGDAIDFIEWSATIEMIARLKRQVDSLGEGKPG